MPIRRIAIATSAAVFALLLGVERAPALSETPQASLTLPKARYLSTEGVSASLVIHNPTPVVLSYNPLSVSFVIRGDDGKSFERRTITVVTRPIPSEFIEPGERRRFEIALPTCEVISDPCTEHVSLKLSVARKDIAGTIPLTTSEVSYSFVADPTATYRVTGLRGNRPLFFAPYEADGSVLLRLLTIRFQFAAAPSTYQTAPPEGEGTTRIFERRGLRVGGFGFTTSAAGFQIAVSLENQAVDATVQGAIEDVLRAYGPRVKLVSELFEPDDFELLPFVQKALEGASAVAQRMSDFSGGGTVSEADGAQLDGAELLKVGHDGDDAQTGFRPLNDFLVGGALRESSASATKRLLSVRLKATFAFVGDTVAAGAVTSPSGIEKLAYLGGATRLLGLSERAVLAADRPEIYAVGVTTRQASDRLGLQAPAVATALAAARVRALAEQLGVATTAPNLIAAYPEVEYSAGDVVVATGIAGASTGDLDRSWRALLPINETSPFARIVTIATPMPGPEIPFPEASPTTYLVPISVPDDRTLLAIRADKPSSEAAERFGPFTSDDCRALVLRAQKLSLEAALHMAVTRSSTSGKQLRHLVLAIAEPPRVDFDNACQGVALDRTPTLVHAPIDLIFRTY